MNEQHEHEPDQPVDEPVDQPVEQRPDEQHPDEAAILPATGGRRRRSRSRLPGCLAVLVALAMLAGGLYYGGTRAASWISDRIGGSAADYPGPGTGSVSVEVAEGDSATAICRTLKDQDVVASVDACISAANANPKATGIQVGFYALKKQMRASDAIAVLVDPANLVTDKVTIPEGLTVDQIVAILAKDTKYSAQDFRAALADPGRLGLPAYANGEPEGYLFPSTYSFGPKEKPLQMLQDMVARWRQAADDADLEAAARRLGYTPAELMTVASLVQAEGRGSDMPKIARVIYNRVETTGAPTFGLLQVDATINYALKRSLVAVPSSSDLEVDSPYNTYRNPGLPPGPIEAPGDDALRAAAHPADGNWLFYVTVDLATGETKFTDSYDQFLSFKRELQQYCATQSDRC